MKTSTIIILGVVAAFLIGTLSLAVTYISYKNDAVTLENLGEAKQKNLGNVYDKMWKVLSQKAGVSSEYKNSFGDIFVKIMDARYSKGDGSLMKFITESNPNFDISLYKDLSNSIEGLRTEFANEQKELLDIAMQYNNLIDRFPGSIFLSGKTHMKVQLITSSRTEDALRTGQDNDVDLFEKEKEKQDSVESKVSSK